MPSHRAQEFAAHNISLQENLLGNNTCTLSIKWSRGEVLNVDPLARNGQSSGVAGYYNMPSHPLLLRLRVPFGIDVMRS